MWKDHPVKLPRWTSQFKQWGGTDTGPRTRNAGERHTWSPSWLHAARTGIVRRFHNKRDSSILWAHLQFAAEFRQISVGISVQFVGPSSERSLRQDAERRPAATRLVRRRIVSRARIAHLGRTNCGCRSSTPSQVSFKDSFINNT